MEKRKTTIIFVIGVILTIVSSIFLINNKLSDNQTQLDEVKLVNNNSSKSGMFAIMLQDENGEYKQSTKNDFPTEGYSYNADKSGCIDSKGLEVKDVLTYTNNKFSVRTNKAVYCYVYFDKQAALVKKLKDQENSGLSEGLIGGMYRYQGTNDQVNNYLCLEGKCSSGSDEMYRIIGVTPEGNIKVIKQAKFIDSSGNSTFKWNTKYDENNSNTSYKCNDNGCPEWPDAEIYQTLNKTFYDTLNNNIKIKIQEWNWWYGDIGFDYVTNLTGEELYQIETGKKESQYYGKLPEEKENEMTSKNWDKQTTANIGLIYLNDYYYQSKENGCHSSKNSIDYNKCRDNGWMHLAQNGNISDYEWTMTRIGRWSSSNTNFRAWVIASSGVISGATLENVRSIRPVFYLKNDIQLYGSGTIDDPFTLTEVIPTELENTLRLADDTNTLSETLIGGMYRYQGPDSLNENNVKNFICLSEVGTNGCDAGSSGFDDEMYRIIGITEEGNIKVMKQTKYGSTYAWDTKYDDTTCDYYGCPEWPDSTIYNRLNTIYYNGLNENIKEKIEPQQWWYGDMDTSFSTTLTANEIYKVETGQMKSKYRGPSISDLQEHSGRWKLMDKEAPIGLIYLHDYYYQAKQDSCQSDKNPEYSKCISQGWMHLAQNGNTSENEWIMSRVGRDGTTSPDYYAWYVLSIGMVNGGYMKGYLAVRPVFYLTNDVELGGEGTTEKPFYIVK